MVDRVVRPESPCLEALERSWVGRAAEELVEGFREHGRPLRDAREEGKRRAELHRVDASQDFLRGARGEPVQRDDAFAQARAEDRMFEIRGGLGRGSNRIAPRDRARPQAGKLREDEPHPVRLLPAATELGQGAFIDALLRLDKSAEVEGVQGHEQENKKRPLE